MKKTTRLKKPQIPEIEDLYRFDDLGGRPKYGGVEMTHETDIPTYETIMEEVNGKIAVEADARSNKDTALQKDIDDEVLARQGADVVLQGQIDTIVASSDVKDIVGTYAALEAYDTSTLGDNDIIKVLQDETEQDETTYYRWSTTAEEFSLIGAEGPYYTKAATDILLNGKQNTLTAGDNIQISGDTISATDTTYSAGTNVQISAQNEISATDTTYTAGTGLDLTGTEFSIDDTVALKSEIPTQTSELTNNGSDGTDTYVETADLAPYALSSSLATVATSGDYGDLLNTPTIPAAQVNSDWNATSGVAEILNKPTIPTVPTNVSAFTNDADYQTSSDVASAISGKQDTLTAGANITISSNTISATDTTYSPFVGATSILAGSSGLVPAPAIGDETKFLSGNGLWTTVSQYSLPIADANTLGGIKVGTNLSIDSTTGVLSATDTTYSAFTGTDGTAAGAAGLVPAPATTDAGKYLKADGTWDSVQSPITVSQSTGTSTTDVMSQNATTNMIFPSNDTQRVQIGAGASTVAYTQGVAIGKNAKAQNTTTVAIGASSKAQDVSGVAIGNLSDAAEPNSVALGGYAVTTRSGEVNVGTGSGSYGYNQTSYRVIGGVHDGQNPHDAATVNQLGLARVLTVDDYNFHSTGDTDNGIAVWLLPAGLYQSPYLSVYDSADHRYVNYSGLILVGGDMGASYRTITMFHSTGDTDSFILMGNTGQKQAGDYTTGAFVGKRSSTGSPSSSTKGKVGQMWENTTTHQLYMCTSATGGTYVWEEVAFGGGGGDVISAADWSALWADTLPIMNGVGV